MYIIDFKKSNKFVINIFYTIITFFYTRMAFACICLQLECARFILMPIVTLPNTKCWIILELTSKC